MDICKEIGGLDGYITIWRDKTGTPKVLYAHGHSVGIHFPQRLYALNGQPLTPWLTTGHSADAEGYAAYKNVLDGLIEGDAAFCSLPQS